MRDLLAKPVGKQTQHIRWVILFGILLGSLTGFSQTSLNLKVKPNTAAENFLQSPSAQRLNPSSPLSKIQAVKPMIASGDRRSPNATLQEIYTVDIEQENPQSLVAQLMATGAFEWVELNRTISLPGFGPGPRTEADTPNDDSLSLQWYHDYIGTFTAWDTTQGDSTIVIGILDTGLDYDHPEFEGQVAVSSAEDANGNGRFDPWPSTEQVNGVFGDFDGTDADGNGYVDDVIGYDFTDQPESPYGGDYLFEDPNPRDDNDHGTLVAGIISAKPNNNYGGAGIAPGCRLKILRAFAANGGGEDDDIARAIVYAADNDIKILNFSFGDIYPSQMMHEAIRYAYAKDVVMVGSAGNGTGDNIHYPSNFDEVIAVSATTLSSSLDREILWPLSSFGWTVSLAAPGNGIYTTVVRDTSDQDDDPFGSFSGTSTSAPMVAAAVGMLFSQRGACTPQQVRGILTSSADDIGNDGWDHLTGAGRLNIPQALATVGGSNVQILSPTNDDGAANQALTVVVTALDPEFASLDLEYQLGLEGDDAWIGLRNDVTEQFHQDTLYNWDVSGQAEGEYTLRLRVNKTNGRTAEDRVRVVIDRTAPEIDIKVAAPCWVNDEQKLFFVYRSSDRGRTELHYRPVGGSDYQVLVYDRITRNGHFLIGDELLAAGSIEYFLKSVNEAGLESSTQVETIDFNPQYIPDHLFDTLAYSIPMGHYFNTPTDFDGDGLEEVVMSAYNEQLSFGKLKFYEFNGVTFSEADSIGFKDILIPKDVMDTDGDGLLELLCSVNDSIYVVEQATTGEFPSQIVGEDFGNGHFAARFVDGDQDGTVEVLAKDFRDYIVLRQDGGGYSPMATLADISPDYEGSVAPKALIEDFDGDGQSEILFGDFDGDVLAYEYNGTDFVNTFLDTTLLSRSGSYLAAGDFDGDGGQEFAVAVHTQLNRNEADFEYEPPYWLLRIFKATADNVYQVIWESHFFDIDTDGFNALSAGNLDNDAADELIFSTFPRDYIFEWEGGEMTPSWFNYGNLTTHHMVGDFNGNGVNEVAIGRGGKALFWEKNVSYNGPTPISSLSGQVVDATSTQLRWEAVSNATAYRIWRGELNNGPLFINLIDSTNQSTFMDTGLTTGQEYLYVIEAKNQLLSPVTSEFSNPVALTPHALGALDSVVAVSAYQAKLYFNVPVRGTATDLPRFQLNGNQFPNTLIASGDENTSLLLTFAEPFQTSNVLEVDSTFLDADQAPLLPGSRLQAFSWEEPVEEAAFFTRWEILGDKSARIWFSEPMDLTVTEVERYRVLPTGSAVAVAFSDATQEAIDITIEGAALGALGYPVSIILDSGRAISGAPMLEKEGNVATFSAFEEDLSQVYVYPNPYRGNDFFNGVRFAKLTARCTVTVYTASGRKVVTLEETDGDGGLEWDLTNTAGERVVPGIYLFRVETEEGAEKLGTFSILEE